MNFHVCEIVGNIKLVTRKEYKEWILEQKEAINEEIGHFLSVEKIKENFDEIQYIKKENTVVASEPFIVFYETESGIEIKESDKTISI